MQPPVHTHQRMPPFSDNTIIQHTLSMGHRIHVLSYNPVSDAIEVVQYVAKFAQNVSTNIQTYRYLVWCPATKVREIYLFYFLIGLSSTLLPHNLLHSEICSYIYFTS